MLCAISPGFITIEHQEADLSVSMLPSFAVTITGFSVAGGKAFGFLKEQQRQKLEEINQVRMFCFLL